MADQKQRRRRGVLLTLQGLKKLQEAKSEAEFQENYGNRYTLEALSDRTGLSLDTLMKVLKCEAGVDRQSLKSCFSAFNLVLESSDYSGLKPQIAEVFELEATQSTQEQPEFPEGQVPLDSAFYVERSLVEAECYRAITQPGALIRIKAPRRMGKTSLMARILAQAAKSGYRAVPINFQLADKATFNDLEKCLQWFCASVSLGLRLPNKLTEYWDALFGSKISCKMYFEQYLLTQIKAPLVLALDDVDRLFQYPDLADEFFGLLRTWHEEAKNRDIWKKLRLVVAHSTEVYIPLNVNKSPFNVGLPIELQPFTNEQVQNLVKQYGLDWSDQEIEQLMALVDGHPYLVRLALYHIQQQQMPLEQFWRSHTLNGIYRDHLQQQLWSLQQHPELAAAFTKVVTETAPVELDLAQAFQLQSMGLVHLHGKQVTPSCKLYWEYFHVGAGQPMHRFSSSS
ncbi:MAG: AAA-like domain-containing protein [Nostoc sp. NMS1]|uniref:AAA-like domain-containing protein n=1 Tax=unclassified Nostoc TaxID=2593658 RepID=UPI0025F666CB|nr:MULTISPECIES: AAA-like domain-containing protein [unclassified Nostoc]MBN3907921.1 AAA-like domain-containing protein [Nostoc sp. NMS1]MBN3994045.1 AAA-like domain-containing protein [Nostoc sp. NMS2]